MRQLIIAIAATSTLLASSAFAQPAMAAPAAGAASEYKVAKTIKVGGPGRWDYIAVGPDHLLYVTRSTHEQIIDPASEKVVADITGGGGLHGTAIVPNANKAFVSDGKDAKLLVIDLKTHELLGKVDAADDADGIIYDAGTDRVLVSCGDAAQLLVLDPNADIGKAKVQKVDLGGKPEFLAADGKGRAFVCIEDKDEIAVVDIKSLKVTDRWKLGSGTSPAGLALDVKNGRLLVGCHNEKGVVIDISNGKVLAELPIGKGNDACAFDESSGMLFASGGDGTVTEIGETAPATLGVIQTIKTAQGSRTMAVDPSTHTLYLPTAQFGAVAPGSRWPSQVPDSFGILVVTQDQTH